jgi:transposase
MDETILSLLPPLRACWMKRGQQKQILIPEQRAHCCLFGAFNWRDNRVATLRTEKLNTDAFIAFLEYLLLEVYPTEAVVLVLDNASFHTSQEALAALSLFEERLLLLWLPPRSPKLNPIERFWRHLKDVVAANSLYASLADLILELERFLLSQNSPDHHLRFRLCN